MTEKGIPVISEDKKLEKRFQAYIHRNSFTGEVFYVGIGKKGRELSTGDRSSFWKKYVAKYGYTTDVLIEGIDWYEAVHIEKSLIAQFGRRDRGTGCLVNLTDGGDGAVGADGPWKGKKRPGLTRRKNDPTKKINRPKVIFTEERKKKISERAMGRTPWNKGKKGATLCSDELRAKRVAYRTGTKHSDETKLKMSLSGKGKPKSIEHRMKLTGRVVSEETRRKLSESKKRQSYF